MSRLCDALGQRNQAEPYIAVQDTLFQGWGDAPVPSVPGYSSAVGDDHSPYEYSVAMSHTGLQLRILCEAQGGTPSAASNHRAALRLNETLERTYGVSLERFEEVRDLFAPSATPSAFSLWHAAILSPYAPPEFKLYLNPQVHGPSQAQHVVRQALERLGLGKAAVLLIDQVAPPGSERHVFNYFSLDLTRHEGARVKVYAAHRDATAQELDRMFEIAPSHRRGDVLDYCDAIVGSRGPFASKPMCSCFSFVEGSSVPTAATLHLPVSHYLASDDEASTRVSAYLRRQNLAAATYDAALRCLLPTPRAAATGRVQSYASYRRERAGIRLTAYLSPLLFGTGEHAQSGMMLIAGS